MAETTRASLITDEDAAVFRDALNAGLLRHGIHGTAAEIAALEAVAPALRARWVAEALEDLVCPEYVARAGMAPPVDHIRRVAAEYRDGKR